MVMVLHLDSSSQAVLKRFLGHQAGLQAVVEVVVLRQLAGLQAVLRHQAVCLEAGLYQYLLLVEVGQEQEIGSLSYPRQ
jgi:hypothetical protein